jgi:hypothetical protein
VGLSIALPAMTVLSVVSLDAQLTTAIQRMVRSR